MAWSPIPRPKGDRNLFQTSLRADYDVSSAATITSLTTYNYMQQAPVTDLDGSAYNLVDEPQDFGHIFNINEELRISNQNQTGAPYRWTFGGNYDKTSVHEDQWITYADNGLSDAANLFINNSGINEYAHIKNYAVFANGEYDVLPRLTLRAGARYTKSKNDTSICGYSPGDGRVDTLFTILGQLIGNPPETIPLGPSSCYTLDPNNHPGSVYVASLNESNVSWKVGSDFRVTDATLLYANISRGIQSWKFSDDHGVGSKRVYACQTGIGDVLRSGCQVQDAGWPGPGQCRSLLRQLPEQADSGHGQFRSLRPAAGSAERAKVAHCRCRGGHQCSAVADPDRGCWHKLYNDKGPGVHEHQRLRCGDEFRR